MENVRYNLWAGEIISSISYLNNLQNICFDFHFNETEMIYFKYPFNLHFEGVFIFNSVCIERYRPLIARSLPAHCPLIGRSIVYPLHTVGPEGGYLREVEIQYWHAYLAGGRGIYVTNKKSRTDSQGELKANTVERTCYYGTRNCKYKVARAVN